MKISAYSQLTSSDFACEVSFQPQYYVGNSPIEGTPFHCRVMFVLVEDEWKLVALTNIAEESTVPESDTTDDTADATTTAETAATTRSQ